MTKNFERFELKPFILKAISELGFKEPTAVQMELIPVIQSGRSVVGQSQTGSGKTHTFLLPIFNALNLEKDDVQAVITAPSRELATQIYHAAQQLASFSGVEIRISNYVGGTDKKRQIEKLKGQQPHIVIGTPGRILDLIKEQALKVHTATTFVVDEADMTLDMGFLNEVDQIAGHLPENLQMLVFSATIPQKLQPFLKKYMKNPLIANIQSQYAISPTIDNWLVATQGKQKVDLIYQILTMGQPYLAMIFANTKQHVDELAEGLKERGLKVAKIHGDIPPRERKRVMRQIQNLEYQFVVATDLAARGIDIEGVSHVINAEIPNDLEFFIHRVGRTGRKGMSGIAITLYEPSQSNEITEIEKLGVTFKPKAIKNGEIIDSYDRNRREKREPKKNGLDPSIKGTVHKQKKKVKPGYKKKIKKVISDKDRQNRRVATRRNNKKK